MGGGDTGKHTVQQQQQQAGMPDTDAVALSVGQ
jgi:hypothetical protein